MHCWPESQRALAEISRILKPDGIFVGSTIGFFGSQDRFIYQINRSRLNEIFPIRRSTYNNKSVKEIEDLFKLAGLEKINITKNRQYIQFSAKKPAAKN